MRICVTGHTGFIGRHLLPLLRDYEVIGLSRSTGFSLDSPSLPECDVLIHLAAETDEDSPNLFRTNVLGTSKLMEEAKRRGMGRVIFASTCGVYGDTKDRRVGRERPETPYEWSKYLAEGIVRESGIPYTILRLGLVYGPDRRWKRFFDLVRAGFPVIGSGDQEWMMVYVKDAAKAFLWALEEEKTEGKTYNIVYPERIKVGELYREVRGYFGKGEPWHLPLPLARLLSHLPLFPLRPHYLGRLVRWRVYSVEEALRDGWRPEYDFKRGMRETLSELYGKPQENVNPRK